MIHFLFLLLWYGIPLFFDVLVIRFLLVVLTFFSFFWSARMENERSDDSIHKQSKCLFHVEGESFKFFNWRVNFSFQVWPEVIKSCVSDVRNCWSSYVSDLIVSWIRRESWLIYWSISVFHHDWNLKTSSKDLILVYAFFSSTCVAETCLCRRIVGDCLYWLVKKGN